jgi:hypothetical protein
MKKYYGFIPPCAIFCGNCSKYLKEKNSCPGAGEHCKSTKCKIYTCCFDKNNKRFCYECNDFSCKKLKEFTEKSILEYGNNLIEEQEILKKIGSKKWLELKNNNIKKHV